MKKTAVIIGTLAILVGGSWIALNPNEVVNPEVDVIALDPTDIAFLTENMEFVTSTDENENVIKTGVRVLIKYNFPVATTTFDGTTTSTVYIVQEIDGAMEMNFGGYNQCRQTGKTKAVCLSAFRSDVEYNVRVFQENVQKELEELQQSQFQDEIVL